MKYQRLFILLLFALILAFFIQNKDKLETPSSAEVDLNKHPLYSLYQIQKQPKNINFAIQPLGVPIGAIAELFQRDEILQKALDKLGFKLNFYDFLKGSDINFFWDKGLNIGMGGDMPTLMAAAHNEIIITSLIKQEFTSLVAREFSLLSDLKGKTVAVPLGSNAHYSVLRALKLENIDSQKVNIINLAVNEYAEALEQRKIDAFAAWEPFPALARLRYPEFVTIHKGLSTAYLFFSKELFSKNPEVLRLVLAAQIRAMSWINESKHNLFLASEWQLQSYEKITKKKSLLSVAENAELIRNGLLSISETPVIPLKSIDVNGFLHQAFLFLKHDNRIDESVSWNKVHQSFKPEILSDLFVKKQHYQLEQYSYLRGFNE